MDQAPALHLTIDVSAAVAEHLAMVRCRDFVDEQPHRFRHIEGDVAAPPTDESTVMYFCQSVADAVLLRAFEQQCGYTASLLRDGVTGLTCVRSARPVRDRVNPHIDDPDEPRCPTEHHEATLLPIHRA